MTTNSLQIKLMSLQDLSQLMTVERQVFNPPSSASVMRDALSAAHIKVWGLLEEASLQLMGFGVLSVILDEAELLTLAIAPQFQGHGLGRKLMEFLVAEAISAKAESLYLEVRASHIVARSLYRSLGFTELGIRKEYYPIVDSPLREDALLLSLRLAEAARIEKTKF